MEEHRSNLAASPQQSQNIVKTPVSPQVIASQANVVGGGDLGLKTPNMEELLERMNKLEQPTPQ